MSERNISIKVYVTPVGKYQERLHTSITCPESHASDVLFETLESLGVHDPRLAILNGSAYDRDFGEVRWEADEQEDDDGNEG